MLEPTPALCACRYYEAFPPLSEKPVCLQEIMTVWNKAKACASSSSSSAAPQTSTDTSSPKDCNSDGEAAKPQQQRPQAPPAGERGGPRRSRKEKENQQQRSGAQAKRPGRQRPEGKPRPRPRSWSWSSGSSEGGRQGEGQPPRSRALRPPHRSRDSRRTRNSGQAKAAPREERRPNAGAAGGGGCPAKAPALHKKGKRLLKEIQKEPGWKEATEAPPEAPTNREEYMEEPLWYTEPIAHYFVPCSRQSKLETKYRSEAPQGPARACLAAGSFVDGRFVEGPGGEEDAGSPGLPPAGGSRDLDGEHLSQFPHFYEVDLYRSTLDTSASDSVQESRILSMIRQKSRDAAAPPPGKGAIGPQEAAASLGFLVEDLENIAQLWGRCSPSTSSEDSLAGDSPVRLSPLLDSVSFALSAISGYVEEPGRAGPGRGYAVNASRFSVLELQYDDGPAASLARGPPADGTAHPAGCLEQSRLLIWTKNSAFEETEHCSNLSTRTCSPWSHSEETRSDTEQAPAPTEGPAAPPLSAAYPEDQILDFLHGKPVGEEAGGGAASGEAKRSKLESVCGIALEEDESDRYAAAAFPGPRGHDYSSGIIEDIWTAMGQEEEAARQGRGPFPDELGAAYGRLPVRPQAPPGQQERGRQGQAPQARAVQRSEYHLWDSKKQERDPAKSRAPGAAATGDYTTPSKPWDLAPDREATSFLLGGVYGEPEAPGGAKSWAALPAGRAQSSLLQCAASDVLSIAGGCFAPGHRPLWRPLVSFGQSEQAGGGGADSAGRGFSFIFREDLLGPYGRLRGEEPGLDHPLASFRLNEPFSQVLHVECSLEPEDLASFSPAFKPRSILCSEPQGEPACGPRALGLERTQYRAIRISPRTHFRPISASELSPGGASDSEPETDKEEAAAGAFAAPADAFDDPQADLTPLEEDAEREGPCYGKSELESGKFLPRLKKSGMEKSAQTSLDSQEGPQEAGPPPGRGGPGTATARAGNAPEVSLLLPRPAGLRAGPPDTTSCLSCRCPCGTAAGGAGSAASRARAGGIARWVPPSAPDPRVQVSSARPAGWGRAAPG